MPDRVKVAIVGSGPAGLSAAARAAQLGMAHVLLEKTDHLSDTIYKYQKGKHVMATPSNLVLRSDIDFVIPSFVFADSQWRNNHFTLEQRTNAAISGDQADPDRDGFCNLIEYAMLTNPWTSDRTNPQVVAGKTIVLGQTYQTKVRMTLLAKPMASWAVCAGNALVWRFA